MSVLGKLGLLGPHTHGVAYGETVFKAMAENSQADEALDVPLGDEGEYL